jgi:hypothetical protein
MDRYTPQRIYELLPSVYRQRDAEADHPLRDLIFVLGEQARVLEDEIEQLYLNLFIETCEDWVVPYIGDLIGVRPTTAKRLSTRAEVANTVGYRRRKGTLAVIEQLARDVTGWPARAVEYFTLLSTNQNLNHLRLANQGTPDLRNSAELSRLGGPFEHTAHLLEVRRIETGAGRYNAQNIGIHLWRLSAYELNRAAAFEVADGTGLHYTVSPLGDNTSLFRRPAPLERPFDSATERNVPDPIRRSVLNGQLGELYGEASSVGVWEGDVFMERDDVAVCDLTDWQHTVPTGKRISIDPELGRISFVSEPEGEVWVRYHYGFSADIGGGGYERPVDSGVAEVPPYHVAADPREAAEFGSLAEALAEWSLTPEAERPNVIEIDDNAAYSEGLPDIALPEQTRLTIRAANRRRPALVLANEWTVVGEANAKFELNGLLIGNHALRVGGQLETLRIKHCTFVPGRRLSESGDPVEAGEVSLQVEAATTLVEIERSIIGPIRAEVDAQVRVLDSIVDANNVTSPAYRGSSDDDRGGVVEFERSTIIGTVEAMQIRLASDSLFLGVVEVVNAQQGCLRFCFVPLGSVVPFRFRCQPETPEGASFAELEHLAAAVQPRFTSLRYGKPGYCQPHKSPHFFRCHDRAVKP